MKNLVWVLNEYRGKCSIYSLIKRMKKPEKEIKCLCMLEQMKIITFSENGNQVRVVNEELFFALMDTLGLGDE